MRNFFLLIPLCICIWILSIVAVHFYTNYTYQKKLNNFILTEVVDISQINKELLASKTISQKLIENNEHLLRLNEEASKTIDFALNVEFLQPIYSNLSNINLIIKENYTNQQIYSALDKQHLKFIHTYLIELESILQTTIFPSLQSSKDLPKDSLNDLLEATSSYYNQYKNT